MHFDGGMGGERMDVVDVCMFYFYFIMCLFIVTSFVFVRALILTGCDSERAKEE